MKPTYIDLLRARRNVSAALYSMWNAAEAGQFEVAMVLHFEYLFALDELNEISNKIHWSERNAAAEAYGIADGWWKEDVK